MAGCVFGHRQFNYFQIETNQPKSVKKFGQTFRTNSTFLNGRAKIAAKHQSLNYDFFSNTHKTIHFNRTNSNSSLYDLIPFEAFANLE